MMNVNTKIIWKVFITVIIITTTACGQQRGGQQRKGQQGPPELPSSNEIKEMVNNLAEELVLNEEQETTVLKLYTEHFEEVKDKMKSGRPDRNEMETLRANFEKDIQEVLAEEQQVLYAKYLKKNRPKGKGNR